MFKVISFLESKLIYHQKKKSQISITLTPHLVAKQNFNKNIFNFFFLYLSPFFYTIFKQLEKQKQKTKVTQTLSQRKRVYEGLLRKPKWGRIKPNLQIELVCIK